VKSFFPDPFRSDHYGDYFTECPSDGTASDSCTQYGKQIDGAVILSLVHAGSPLVDPSDITVAKTVGAYNLAFCEAYPINIKDTTEEVPGILYGRYLADKYGGGNPWHLITASLSHLLYQAAGAVSTNGALDGETLAAWKQALGESFTGTRDSFLAAGDSVLSRLKHHLASTGQNAGFLYEQLDKNTGAQYNAKSLTWSYAEVFDALHQRGVVMALPLSKM